MKKIPLQITVCFIALSGLFLSASFTSEKNYSTISEAASSYTAAASFKELLLQIDQTNDKNYTVIRTSLEGAEGVFFRGYCPELHTFMYVVNRDLQPENTFLDKLTVQGISYAIKEGTIQQVSEACGMDATQPANPSPTETE